MGYKVRSKKIYSEMINNVIIIDEKIIRDKKRNFKLTKTSLTVLII